MARVAKQKRRRGTAAVRAAMMMPLSALPTFALIKYGRLYVKVQQINNAARRVMSGFGDMGEFMIREQGGTTKSRHAMEQLKRS